MGKIKLSVILLLFGIALHVSAADYKIIPEPLNVSAGNGNYVLPGLVQISVNEGFCSNISEIRFLKDVLKTEASVSVDTAKTSSVPGIVIRKDCVIKNEEAYQLVVSATGITISAGGRPGLFYAIQTLRQLLWQSKVNGASRVIPAVTIQDQPRFPYRGLMLDPARHFLPVEDLKRYVDVMALYKFNQLHLHLSDDQGWRIEIQKYPRLTAIGSVRRETDGDGQEHRGYYTREEMKELVVYAADRHVTLIPEIDVPGHSVAAIAAYPELTCFSETPLEVRTAPGVSKDLLCAGKEEVFVFIDAVVEELSAIFPGEAFHIGGDEVPLDHWKKCPRCRQRMLELNLSSAQDLMSYFLERVNESLLKYQKRPLIWYELDVPKYPQNSTMFAWRKGLAPSVIRETGKKGYQVISSPGEHAYFDYPQAKGEETCDWMPVLSLEKVYRFDPLMGVDPGEGRHVTGVEATIWGEYVKDINRAFYMTWPRGMAFAEAGWSVDSKRSWEHFTQKLDIHLKWMKQNGIGFGMPQELKK